MTPFPFARAGLLAAVVLCMLGMGPTWSQEAGDGLVQTAEQISAMLVALGQSSQEEAEAAHAETKDLIRSGGLSPDDMDRLRDIHRDLAHEVFDSLAASGKADKAEALRSDFELMILLDRSPHLIVADALDDLQRGAVGPSMAGDGRPEKAAPHSAAAERPAGATTPSPQTAGVTDPGTAGVQGEVAAAADAAESPPAPQAQAETAGNLPKTGADPAADSPDTPGALAQESDADRSGSSAEAASGEWVALETLTVPADKPQRIQAATVLEEGHLYIIDVRGTFSVWSSPKDVVDAVWCFRPGRCEGGKRWDELKVDDEGLSEIHEKRGGDPEDLALNPDHRYRVRYEGRGVAPTFWISDALGSSFDNSGALTVTILGRDAGGAMAESRPPADHPGSAADATGLGPVELLGTWEGCDGRRIEFTAEGGELVGRYRALGRLGKNGFSLGELGYRHRPLGGGRYQGEDLRRFRAGGSEWRASTITVTGDQFSDTGADPCSRSMVRVAAATVPAAQTPAAEGPAGAIVLDVSNSMWGQIEGRSKIEIAREAVGELVAGWTPGAELGLVAYGHRREGDCADIETVIPVGPLDSGQFTTTVDRLKPKGKTPLTAAVRHAADMLAYQDRPATVILFSDGIETCRADPCALGEELQRSGIGFTAHVIGIDTAADQHQLACLAEATGGLYLTADSSRELTQALQSVRSVATAPGRSDLVTLEAADEATGEVLREGVVWTVVSLDSEERVPITAGTARPALPLAPGSYFVEARRGGAVGRLSFEVTQGDAATHRVLLAAGAPDRGLTPSGAAPGLVAEAEPNSSFGTANLVGVASDPSAALSGQSFGTARPLVLAPPVPQPPLNSGQPPGGDADWYRFRVADQGVLHLLLAHSPTGADLAARVWDAEKSTISGWLDLDRGEKATNLPRSGEYVLEVRNNSREALPAGAYRLKASFAPSGDVHEPNDSFGRAAPIPPTGSLSARISPQGDTDWFVLEVPDQGQLALRRLQGDADIEPTARLWNADKSSISSWLTLGERLVLVDLPEKGRYTIEIRDGRNDPRSLQPSYVLETEFTATGDSHEPNNGFGAAAEVGLTQPITGSILPKGDVDWYALTVEDQGELTLRLSKGPEAIDLVGRLWDEDKSTLSGWLELGERPVTIDLPRKGHYVLELHDGRDDARSPDAYELVAAFSATGDPHEPNDSFGASALLELGGAVSGTILPKGDVDWFAFDVRQHGELTIDLTQGPEVLDPVMRLWDADKGTISGWLELRKGPVAFDLPEPGRYVLELRDGRDDARSPEAYRLATSFTASGEGPDGVGAAADVADGTVQGTILPAGDSDWYRITADAPGGLTIEAIHVPAELDLVVRVWNAEKRSITGWLRAEPGSQAHKVPLPALGPYRLEVRDARNKNRSLEFYRLRLTWPGMQLSAQ